MAAGGGVVASTTAGADGRVDGYDAATARELKRTAEEVLELLVEEQVVRAARRRRVAEQAADALLREVVIEAVRAALPPLRTLIARSSYAAWKAQCGMSWEDRVLSQPLQQSDEDALANAGWDYRHADDRTVATPQSGLTKGDLHTLGHSAWLNDKVINTYLALLVERGRCVAALPSVHCMSSHFFAKLQATGCDYAALKRWTKNVDVFSFDVLLIPVHNKKHWTLGVVDFERRVIGYYDSRGAVGRSVVDVLVLWLNQEWAERRPNAPARDFDAEFTPHLPGPAVPQQINNNNDCGVFACAFANCVTARRDVNCFAQEHIRYIRGRMTFELLRHQVTDPM